MTNISTINAVIVIWYFYLAEKVLCTHVTIRKIHVFLFLGVFFSYFTDNVIHLTKCAAWYHQHDTHSSKCLLATLSSLRRCAFGRQAGSPMSDLQVFVGDMPGS